MFYHTHSYWVDMRPLGMTFHSTTHHIQSSHSNHHTDTARCISFLCLLLINLYIAKRSAAMRCRSSDAWGFWFCPAVFTAWLVGHFNQSFNSEKFPIAFLNTCASSSSNPSLETQHWSAIYHNWHAFCCWEPFELAGDLSHIALNFQPYVWRMIPNDEYGFGWNHQPAKGFLWNPAQCSWRQVILDRDRVSPTAVTWRQLWKIWQ